MDLDDALHMIGDFGRGQILVLFAVSVISQMVPSWVSFGITFLGAFPNHFCKIPSDAHIEDYIPSVETDAGYVYDSCTQYANPGSSDNSTVPCRNGSTFSKTPYGTTIVSEWDLVCDRTQLVALAQSVLMIGVMVGSIIFGYVSDLFGRKRVLMMCLFSQGCLGVVLSLSPSYWFFLMIRFFEGITHQGCIMPGYSMVSEIFTPRRRAIAFIISSSFWAIGTMILALVAFFIRDWRYLQLAISLPCFVVILICWFVPESPRWLLSVGKLQEATTILKKLARFNGSNVGSIVLSRKPFGDCGISNKSFVDSETKEADKYDQQETKDASSDRVPTVSLQVVQDEMKESTRNTKNNSKTTTTKSSTYLYLLKTRRMSLVTIVVSITWLANAFAYHGLNLNSVRLAGNPYLNLFLTGAVEIPANLVATILSVKPKVIPGYQRPDFENLVNMMSQEWGTLMILILSMWMPHIKFGRRKSLCALLIMSSVACVVTGFIPKKSARGVDLTAVIVTSAVAGKFFVTSSIVINALYATEIFPTVVRNKGIGVAVMTARIGPLLAPFVVLLDEMNHSLPIIIFGVVSALPSFFVLLLPETRGRKQPDTAEDIDLM